MNILHVTTIGFHANNRNSGVPAVLKPLSEEQNKVEGVVSRVLSIRYNQDDFFDTLDGSSMEQYLNEYRPDIVVFHTFFFIEYVKFSSCLVSKHIPYVIEPHGSFGRQAMHKSRVKKWLAIHTLFRPMIKKASAIVYTNQGEKENSLYPKFSNIVIPNGVLDEVVFKSTDKKGSVPIFYYLGRFSIHHKGLDFLMAALRILESKQQEITVYFYGMGDENEMLFINEAIADFHYVKAYLKGTIFGDAKHIALEEANILLLTSRYEGSPMTVLDALSYGNPCLVTPGTNVAEEIRFNKVGWVSELDPQSIADTILLAKNDYISNKDLYTSRCKSYVLNNYSWTKIAKQSVEEYKKIIEEYGK